MLNVCVLLSCCACRVWGVAESTAEHWYQAGCRTLADVQTKVTNLTAMQRVGLHYFEDFEVRVPRAEVAEAQELVAEVTADTLQVRLNGCTSGAGHWARTDSLLLLQRG